MLFGYGNIEVLVGKFGGQAALAGSLQKTALHQVRLKNVFNGGHFLAGRGGQSVQADGAAAELGDDGFQQPPVDMVEAAAVDPQQAQRLLGDLGGDAAVGFDLGVVADAFEQAVGDARRSPRPASERRRRVGGDLDVQDFRRAVDNPFNFLVVVEVEVEDVAKAVAERPGEQADPRRKADLPLRLPGQRRVSRTGLVPADSEGTASGLFSRHHRAEPQRNRLLVVRHGALRRGSVASASQRGRGLRD